MTGGAPRVSVIVPTYNRVDRLQSALQSVVRQTYEDWELVVVDDGSTDDTEHVVRAYEDTRIRYVRHQSNGGVAVAQNTGIDHAFGEFIVFLHSDDELLPRKLEAQVDLMDRSPATVGAVQSALLVDWSDHAELWPPTLEGANGQDLLAYRVRVHISPLMIRRPLAAAIRFDPSLRAAEDRDFCIRLLRTTSLAFSYECLSRVVKTDTGLGSQSMAPMYLALLEKYRSDIELDNGLHAQWQFRIARAHARAGDPRRARQALARSLRLNPAQVRRWPLWLASLAGDTASRHAFDRYVRFSRARRRTRF